MSDAEEERYDGLGAAEEQEEEEQEVQGELHHDTSRKQRRRREMTNDVTNARQSTVSYVEAEVNEDEDEKKMMKYGRDDSSPPEGEETAHHVRLDRREKNSMTKLGSAEDVISAIASAFGRFVTLGHENASAPSNALRPDANLWQVRARSQKQVSEACNGLVGIYPSRGVTLISPKTGEEGWTEVHPRIDLTRKMKLRSMAKKRKKTGLAVSTGVRPPQRFFNYEEVVKVYGRKMVSKRSQAYIFQNDTYKDGFIEKDFNSITRFARGNQEGEGIENMLQPGDHVRSVRGRTSWRPWCRRIHQLGHRHSQSRQKVQVPARSVRKRFKPGDHVKVMSGKNADESGLVVSVAGNIVTFLSDMSMQEVSVFSKDLREAAEVGTGTNIVGNYELHDLVQLENGEVRLVQPHQISMRRDSNRAIATDAEGYELRVGDNMKENDGEGRKGRVLHVHQSFFAFLHNREIIENGGVFVTRARSLVSLAPKGNIIRPGTDLSKMNPALSGGVTGGMVGSGMGRGPRDRLIGVLVTVVKGPQKGYIGIIKDTNGPIARVELNTNNKVITIEKERLYRRNKDGKLEPLEGGRDMGPPRGGFGDGGFSGGFGSSGGRTPNPYATSGGSSWGGRTPNPYSGGKTPAWSSSKTPNPEGGRTPFHTSSQTPNPYAQDGGRTPGWGPSARTPNPYTAPSKAAASTGSGWGGATPGWGGATPKPSSSSWNESASPAPTSNNNGWASPGPTSSGGWGGDSSWVSLTDVSSVHSLPRQSAPTPAFGAPTPASAPTPGGPGYGSTVYNAQTPVGMFPNRADMPAETPAAYPPHERTGKTAFKLDKFWLVDPAYASHKIGMVVKMRGTRGDSANLLEWDHGQYEGKEGKVLGVLDTGSEFIPRTATLQMDEGESLTVPIIYLVPVPPTQVRNRVVALDGRYKGKVVTVRDMMLDSCLVTDDDSMYDDLTHDRMCLYLSDQ
ncbi:hypothetical protein EDB84DRAFT_1495355 [Lactarius hengduanensis]|nr:hypothetical protein EDB84DRAFT_1495355 [Lactarius hengduanensis]